jgi:phospholipase A-2-activating protein
MVPKAYMWKDGKWEYVGEVMAQAATEKSHYHGDRFFAKGEYDYVFDVDVGDDAPKAKLPYNEGDNSLVVAEKFLTREGMNLGFKDQIIDFIRKNSRGGAKAATGGKSAQPQAQTQPKSCFPMRQAVFFQDMNMEGLSKKLEEFHAKMQGASDVNQALILNETDYKYIQSITNKLRDPALFQYIKEFSSFEIESAKKAAKWPGEFCVPVMDLWRCIVLHHASQVFFSGVDSGMPIIAALVGKLKNGPPVIWTVFFKFLSNLFIHTSNMTAIVRSKDIIQEAFKLLNKSDSKVVAQVANYLMNLSTNLDCISTLSDEFLVQHVEYINDLVQHASLSPEALLKLAIALGNFATLKPSVAQQAKPIITLFLNKMENSADDTSKQIVDSFKTLSQ